MRAAVTDTLIHTLGTHAQDANDMALEAVAHAMQAPNDAAFATNISHDLSAYAHGAFAQEELEHVLSLLSLDYYATRYLPNYFTVPFNDRYHGDLFPIYRKIETHAIHMPVVIAGWRECGKTSYGQFLLPLRCITLPAFGMQHNVNPRIVQLTKLEMRKRFIVFVSSVITNARASLSDVCDEIENNTLLREDYGVRLRQRAQTNALTSNGVMLTAKSRHSKFRTLKFQQFRPDLMLLDEVEDDKSVQNRARRDEDFQWLTRVIINTVSTNNGNVLLQGNWIHDDSLMGRAMEHGKACGWITRLYRAEELNETTGEMEFIWPEKFGAEWKTQKMQQLLHQQSVYEQEYLQNPHAGNVDLSLADFTFYEEPITAQFLSNTVRFTAVDPAISKARTADDTSICTIAYNHATGIVYVLPFTYGHFTLSEMIEKILLANDKYKPHTVGVERVAFQAALEQSLSERARRDGILLNVVPIKQTTGIEKSIRVKRMYNAIKQGWIRFIQSDVGHRYCIDQIINIDTTAHDDLADSLEMAIRLRDNLYIRSRSRGRAIAHVAKVTAAS